MLEYILQENIIFDFQLWKLMFNSKCFFHFFVIICENLQAISRWIFFTSIFSVYKTRRMNLKSKLELLSETCTSVNPWDILNKVRTGMCVCVCVQRLHVPLMPASRKTPILWVLMRAPAQERLRCRWITLCINAWLTAWLFVSPLESSEFVWNQFNNRSWEWCWVL